MRNALPKTALLVLTLLAGAAPAQAGTDWPRSWSSLWRNADQRGQALLQQGDASAAAKEFADPRRKSYAEFKAGDYAAAARDLSAFDDSDAHYNRANALAYAGDLQGALKAYDAALKRDPNNQDARHNRELVAKALKQQQQQQQQKKDGGKSDPKNGKQDDKKNSKQDGNKQDNQQDGKQGGQAQSEAGAGKPGQKGQNDPRQAAQDKPGGQPQQDKDKAGGQQDAQAQQGEKQDKKQDNKQDKKRNDAEQARRDVDAGMKQAKQDHAASPTMGADANDKRAAAAAPLSEKQISQDQWLRSIPDDPGGLLRRKFLIEHMLRQQHAQQ